MDWSNALAVVQVVASLGLCGVAVQTIRRWDALESRVDQMWRAIMGEGNGSVEKSLPFRVAQTERQIIDLHACVKRCTVLRQGRDE